MKKILLALAFAGVLLTGAARAEVETGKAAPDFSFTDSSGAAHKLSDFKGKTVVLEWTNPGCPFVKKFYGAKAMQKFQTTKFKGLDIVWVAINSSAKGKEGFLENDADAQKWTKENGFNGTYYTRDVTGVIGKAYGAKTTPHMFVIDKDGVLQYQGAIDSIKSPDAADITKADNYVLSALKALSEGAKPAVTSSEPYGCGVKYGD